MKEKPFRVDNKIKRRKVNILIVTDNRKYREKEDYIRSKFNGYNIGFFHSDYENRIIKLFHSFPGFTGNVLSHLSYWLLSSIYAIKIRILYRNKYSHIIFINPLVGFYYSLFFPHSNRVAKFYIAGFLFAKKNSRIYYYLRHRLVKLSFKRAERIFVYSSTEVDVYSSLFPEIKGKIKFVRYGRDFDIIDENNFFSDNKYFASGGISNRDYKTLIKAMKIVQKKNPEIICKVATRPVKLFKKASVPENLKFIYDIRLETFGSFIEKSDFVVIPLLNTSLSAGHMVMLESMFRGKNIIISDIPAVRDYVNDDLVFFFRPGDENDLADKILSMYSEYNLPELQKKSKILIDAYTTSFTFMSLLKRIITEVA